MCLRRGTRPECASRTGDERPCLHVGRAPPLVFAVRHRIHRITQVKHHATKQSFLQDRVDSVELQPAPAGHDTRFLDIDFG